jgi:hypothetical protein
MTVTRREDGKWAVMKDGAEVAGPFEEMAAAWRWIDRHDGEPINHSEKVGDWISARWNPWR